MKKWTTEEINIIIDNYKNMSDDELCSLLPNRTKTGIECKRKSMGLIRPVHKRYSFDTVLDEFMKRPEYILLSTNEEYKDCNSKIRYLCKNHIEYGEQKISLYHLLQGQGCSYCGKEKSIKSRMVIFDKKQDKMICDERNLIYIDTIRKDNLIYIQYKCPKHLELGVQESVKYNLIRSKNGCKYCYGKQLPKQYVLMKAKEINPNIVLLEEYKNLTTRMNCFCKKHQYYTRKSMQEILKGQGCYYCGKEKLSKLNTLSIEEYQEKVSKKNENLIVLEYNGVNYLSKFKCKICEHEWYSNSISIKQCPNCAKYYTGEKQISDFLLKFGIEYIREYTFDECKDKNKLRFDFYLPDYNTCIEFDGLQHFEQRKGWTDLKLIQYHDKIKTDYCNKNKIILIRVPYWEQENLNCFLFDELVKNNIIEEII